MESPAAHVAVVAFPFSSHPPKLLAVARALATAAPSATISFLSTATSLDSLRGAATPIPTNLRFIEVPTGVTANGETPSPWRRMELFLETSEAGGLKRSLDDASRAAANPVSCVVGDAFMPMAADAGVPYVAVWTGSPCALLAHLSGAELLKGGAAATGTHGVISRLLHRVSQRLPGAATAIALNMFPGLFPPDVTAQIAAAIPNGLAIGPYHLLPGAASDSAASDPHGCLPWLDRQPDCSVVYVSFGTVAAPPPDELRELAVGLEAAGAPSFLWSLKEDSWSLLPPGFLDRTAAAAKSGSGGGLVVPWTPQAAVLRHRAVGAFVAHSGWGAVVEGMSGGVPMACRPFFGDQNMNARAVAETWGFGISFGEGGESGGGGMTRGSVAVAVAALMDGEEGETIRARARELKVKVEEAFQCDGGSMNNFRKLVEIVCAPRV
ncbi:unnamed protein product [Urochloa humidicola]